MGRRLGGFHARFNGGGSVRAAVSTFARFDSDRPWSRSTPAAADGLDAIGAPGGDVCLIKSLCYECRRQEAAMGFVVE